jgi:peptide chain release factor 1
MSAKESLLLKLDKQYNMTKYGTISNIRKEQVGSGQRSDKIRTISFPRNEIKDHRLGKKITAERFISGFINELWN